MSQPSKVEDVATIVSKLSPSKTKSKLFNEAGAFPRAPYSTGGLKGLRRKNSSARELLGM